MAEYVWMFDSQKEAHINSQVVTLGYFVSYCIQTAWVSLDKITEKPENQIWNSNTQSQIIDIVWFFFLNIDYNLALESLINKVFLQTS